MRTHLALAGALLLILAGAACGHKPQPGPTSTVQTTTAVTSTATPTTTPTAPTTSTGTFHTPYTNPPPFENPPNSTGLGKG